ncbi:MAG: protein involved in polysaccharide export with SLBB domain [Lysobacterales bacterium]|jgi:protein involved in polysaccharide export with SLBB domain
MKYVLNLKSVSAVFKGVLTVLIVATTAHAQNFAGGNMSGSDVNAPLVTSEAIMQKEAHEYYQPNVEEIIENFSHYTLGQTDILEITVLRHPEVSGQFVINQEGNLQYEFVGDIQVEGKTKDEVKTILENTLSEFIVAPSVTVKIVGYNSKVVYVIGEVGHPGKIYMRGDTINVREALIQAGLPTLSAKTAQSLLITPADKGQAIQKKVNVKDLLFKGDLRENFVMKPGDTLYVPPTIMAKALRVIQPVTAPVSAASGGVRTVTTGF